MLTHIVRNSDRLCTFVETLDLEFACTHLKSDRELGGSGQEVVLFPQMII